MKRAFLVISTVLLCACSHSSTPKPSRVSALNQDPDLATQRLENEVALNQIHQVNERELALARVALRRSQAFEVQQLAQSIVANHEELETRVKNLAKDESVKLLAYQPTATDTITFQRLKELNGKAFDEAIRWSLCESQQHASTQFRQLALRSEEPGIVVMLADILPKIRKQEEQASNALSDFNELDLNAKSE